MPKKSKKITRTTYVNKMKEDVRAILVDIGNKRSMMTKTWAMMSTLTEPHFPDTKEGAKEEAKYKKELNHLKDLIKQFKTYSTNDAYRPTIVLYMEQLRESDEPEEWASIYHKWEVELKDVQTDINRVYRELVMEMQRMIRKIRELKRKELEEKMRDTTMNESVGDHLEEYFKEDTDDFDDTMYEDTNSMEGVEDIYQRTEIFKDYVEAIYNEGAMDREIAEAWMGRLNTISQAESEARIASLSEEYPTMESAVDGYDAYALLESFINLADEITMMKESGEMDPEIANNDILSMVNTYCETMESRYLPSDDTMVSESTVEMYAENADLLKETIYEQCSRGEISLEEREEMLSTLNDYKYATAMVCEHVVDAIQQFGEGTVTGEELDTIVEGYNEQYPAQMEYLRGEDIQQRTEVFKDCINTIYNEGTIDRATGKAWMDRLNTICQSESAARFSSFLGDDAMMEESATDTMLQEQYEADDLLQSFIQIADHIALMKESGEVDPEVANMDVLRMIATYCEAMEDLYPSYVLADHMVTEAAVNGVSALGIGMLVATIGAIIGAGVGYVVTKKQFRTFVNAYEKMYNLPIKLSDLKFKKVAPYRVAESYLPDLRQIMDNDIGASGTAWLIEYKKRPFAALAVLTGNAIGAERPYYKLLYTNPDVRKHQDYYRTAIISSKHLFVDPEAMSFFKSFYKDLKQKERESKKEAKVAAKAAKATKAVGKTASKNASKILKEFTESTNADFAMYDQVEQAIYEEYQIGNITLEQKEALIMEARRKFF